MADQTPKRRDPPNEANDRPGDASAWVALSSVGIEFILTVLLPGALGWWLDRKFGTAPWIMLAAGLFGCVAGFYVLLKAVKGTR